MTQVSAPTTLGGSVPSWDLTDRLRKARQHAGLTQAELAQDTEISLRSISYYEKGDKVPRRPQLLAIAFRCGVPYEWLATGVEPDQSPDGPGTQAKPSFACVTAADRTDNVRHLHQSPARTTRSNPALPLSA